jgi:hypothetical protein
LASEAAQIGGQMVQAAVQRKEIDLRNRYEADMTQGQLRWRRCASRWPTDPCDPDRSQP